MNLDNVERRESYPRHSADYRDYLADQDAQWAAEQHRLALLSDACKAIRKLGEHSTNYDIAQILVTLGSSIKHLPAAQELVDVCYGEVECL
jgi:hypothetical protein